MPSALHARPMAVRRRSALNPANTWPSRSRSSRGTSSVTAPKSASGTCTQRAAGVIAVLGIVSLRQDDPDAVSLAVSLAAIKDWTFLLGPGFIVGWGNGLILGYLMYRSGLVPRGMPMLGLIGGPLIVPSGIGVLFDLWNAGGTSKAIARRARPGSRRERRVPAKSCRTRTGPRT